MLFVFLIVFPHLLVISPDGILTQSIQPLVWSLLIAIAACGLVIVNNSERFLSVTPTLLMLALFTAYLPLTLLGKPYTFGSFNLFFWWLEACCFYLVLLTIVQRYKRILALLISVHLLGAVTAIYIILNQWFPTWVSRIGLFKPIAYDPNTLALMLLLPLFLALSGVIKQGRIWQRGCYLLLFFIYLYAASFSDSRAFELASVVALVITLMVSLGSPKPSKKYRSRGASIPVYTHLACMLTLIAAVLAALFTIEYWHAGALEYFGESSGGRIRRWANGMLMVRDASMLGVGIGNWEINFEQFRHLAVADAGGLNYSFNLILELLAEGGLLAIALFSAVLFVALSRRSDSWDMRFAKGALLAFMIYSVFHIPFLRKVGIMLFVLSLLLIDALDAVDRPTQSLNNSRSRWLSLAIALGVITSLGFQLVTTHANARAALMAYKLDYSTDGSATLRLSSDTIKWTQKLFGTEQSLDYRAHSVERFQSLNYTSSGSRKVYGLLGRKLKDTLGCDAAQPWFDKELQRHPNNGKTLLDKCQCDAQLVGGESALKYCLVARDALPAHPEPLIELASLGIGNEPTESVLALLDQAGDHSRRQIGEHEFGRRSDQRVSDYVARERRIKKLYLELANASISAAETRYALAQRIVNNVSDVHKRIAVGKQHIYFSSNESGRYELWRIALEGGAPELVARDTLAPFQLQVSGGEQSVFFIADNRGDYQYQLYQYSLVSRRTQQISQSIDGSSVLQFRYSHTAKMLAYTKSEANGTGLYFYDFRNRVTTRVPGKASRLSKLVWSRDDGQLLFVHNHNQLYSYSVANKKSSKLPISLKGEIKTVTVAPKSGDLLIVEHDRYEQARCYVYRWQTQQIEEIVDAPGGAVEAVWLDSDRVLFRVFDEDRYLLHVANIEKQSIIPIEPRDGVVYPLAQNSNGQTAFLHIGKNKAISLNAFGSQQHQPELLFAFGNMDKIADISISRVDIEAQEQTVPAYLYQPKYPVDNLPVIVWLHGTNSSFSPRWHRHALSFALQGFSFVALNFSGSTGQARPDLSRRDLQHRKLAELKRLIEMIKQRSTQVKQKIVVLGVSQGTLLAQQFARRYPYLVDALVEYSPLRAPLDFPQHIPRLVLAGENDALADLAKISELVAAQQNRQSKLVIYKDEGHELRYPVNIKKRFNETIEFIKPLGIVPNM